MVRKAKRVFITVLDSLGAGASKDAALFGDEGASTLGSLHRTGLLKIDNLISLGLGNVDGLDFLGKAESPKASFARLEEKSMGKDTIIGHWEIAGGVTPYPLPTFPEGFPEELLIEFKKICGREVLCNLPYSGTQVIRDFGDEHVRTGALIVYTSADSVFQIAAHISVVPLDELYSICEGARELLKGAKYGVGRVIARPFEGESGNYTRIPYRRDYALMPPEGLLPEAVTRGGLDSISIGKISDIFAGVGISRSHPTHSNAEGMAFIEEYVKKDFLGLCFANLVDFDMLWGHRRDPAAYAEGLNSFDKWLGTVLPLLGEEDVFIITADHGCDPSFLKTTDHTREDVPLLIYRKGSKPRNPGTIRGFDCIAATVADLLGIEMEHGGCVIDI